jgi:hypothetical protein
MSALLPAELSELISRCVEASGLAGAQRERFERELIAHVRDAVDAGRPLTRIVAEFGDPELTGALVRMHRPPRAAVRRALVAVGSLGVVLAAGVYLTTLVGLRTGIPEVQAAEADRQSIRGLAESVDLDTASQVLDRLVSRMYSTDGHGNGRLTSEGLRIVQRLKGVEHPSWVALTAEPVYFALAASRLDVEREARRVMDVARRARAAGPGSTAWLELEREVARLDWSRPGAYRFVPLAIVVPRVAAGLRRSAGGA